MPYKFIIPPPGRTDMKFMLTDPVNHPNNTPYVMLLKQDGVTHDETCCCVTCCCRFDCNGAGGTTPTPDPLTATLTDKTGDCGCLPSSVTLNFGGPSCDWTGSGATTCGSPDPGPLLLTVVCTPTPPDCSNDNWELLAGCGVAPGGFPLTVVSCNPLILQSGVIDVPGTACCSGTFKVTITG